MIANPTTSAPAVQLDCIGQIAIAVSDLTLSKDFYQNTLGMKFLFDAGQHGVLPVRCDPHHDLGKRRSRLSQAAPFSTSRSPIFRPRTLR